MSKSCTFEVSKTPGLSYETLHTETLVFEIMCSQNIDVLKD